MERNPPIPGVAAAARILLAGLLALPLANAGAVDPTPSYVDPAAGEGCWVLFFAEPEFKQPIGRLGGGIYVGSLTAPGKIGEVETKEFFSYVGSVEVGPEARLEVFGEPMFQKRIAALAGGRRVADAKQLFQERMKSMKILCGTPGGKDAGKARNR